MSADWAGLGIKIVFITVLLLQNIIATDFHHLTVGARSKEAYMRFFCMPTIFF
jgi:hypothetical protein